MVRTPQCIVRAISVAILLLLSSAQLSTAGRSGTTLPTDCLVNISATVKDSHGLTSTQKQEIVDLHNQFRYDISGKASSMPLLKWNEELCNSAAKSLDSLSTDEPCSTTFSAWSVQDRTNLDGYDVVGQNLLTYGQDKARASFPVKHWGGYSQNYTYVTCSSSNKDESMCGKCSASQSDCLSYTQVIWATSTDIGCAARTCGSKHAYFSCLYGPAGNRKGQNPYEASSTVTAQQKKTCQNPQISGPAPPPEEASWKTPLIYVGAFLGVVAAGGVFYAMGNDDCSCCESETKKEKDQEKKRIERERRNTFKELGDGLVDDASRSCFVSMEEQPSTVVRNGSPRNSPRPEKQHSSSSSSFSQGRGSPRAIVRDSDGNIVEPGSPAYIAATATQQSPTGSASRRTQADAATMGAVAAAMDNPENDTFAQAETRARLTRFFNVHNPPQIQQIPLIMQKFEGKEDQMWSALVKKYGPEPSAV